MPIRVSGSGANPECPLCKNTFEKVPYRGAWFYMCQRCEIFIDVLDPAIHAWAAYTPENEKEILCPYEPCGHEMNFFFRSDEYMKAYCPKCHTSVALSGDLPLPKGMIEAREEQERRERDNG